MRKLLTENRKRKLFSMIYQKGEEKMRRLISIVAIVLVSLGSTSAFADTTWVSGTIVGELWDTAGSPYCVEGNILVQGTGLEIQPGVEVVFFGDYIFEVGGRLLAIGTEQDSILFTRSDTLTNWQGIFFNYNMNEELELGFCIIEYSVGHGIYIDNSEPILRNIRISENSLYGINQMGSGIYTNTPLILSNCSISNNTIYSDEGSTDCKGAGIYANAALILHNCTISGNSIEAYNNNYAQTVRASGGGVYANGGLEIYNSTVLNNSVYASVSNADNNNQSHSYGLGGGVYASDTTIIMNSIISANSATASAEGYESTRIYGGGGLNLDDAFLDARNSTFAYNINHGIRQIVGLSTIMNSICFFNSPIEEQIYGDATVTFSDVQMAHNDSVYPGQGNMNENPSFYSPDSLIIVDGSVCIDAGNPDPSYDDACFPPSWPTERNDMGAHGGPGGCGWLDEETGIFDKETENIPLRPMLTGNYPNPFNPSTSISYALSKETDIRLDIYNLLGQRVATLFEGRQRAGEHIITWDASGFPSGIYFARLETPEHFASTKIVMLK